MRLRIKLTLWRHDRVPGTKLFCHKMSLEQNSLTCPILMILPIEVYARRYASLVKPSLPNHTFRISMHMRTHGISFYCADGSFFRAYEMMDLLPRRRRFHDERLSIGIRSWVNGMSTQMKESNWSARYARTTMLLSICARSAHIFYVCKTWTYYIDLWPRCWTFLSQTRTAFPCEPVARVEIRTTSPWAQRTERIGQLKRRVQFVRVLRGPRCGYQSARIPCKPSTYVPSIISTVGVCSQGPIWTPLRGTFGVIHRTF